MNTEKVRFAVVGVGSFGAAHIKGIYANGDRAELVAVCDIRESAARNSALDNGLSKYYTDVYDMLADGGFDCVIVATNDQSHRECSVAALSAGYHVLCEKPLALTMEDCRAIIKAEESSGKKFMVGQVCRKSPSFIKAKEMIDSGELGEIFYVESEYAHDYSVFDKPWRLDKEQLRHGIIGGGCHAIDILRWFAGDPTEVFAYSNHKVLTDWPVDDTTVSIMKFPDGVVGKMFFSMGAKRKYTMRTCVYGSKGTIICDNRSDNIVLHVPFVNSYGNRDYKEHCIPVEQKPHNVSLEISEMIDAILLDKDVPLNAREGARTVAVALAAVESSAKGKPVTPKYPK